MKRKLPKKAALELRNFEVQELEDYCLEGVIGAGNCVCGSDGNCVCGGDGNGSCPGDDDGGNMMCPCIH